MKRRIINSELKSYVLIIAISTVWGIIMCGKCFTNFNLAWRVALFNNILWIALWKGNEYLANYLDTISTWLENPLKAFIWRFLVFIGYTITIVILGFYFLAGLFGVNFGTGLTITLAMAIGIGMIIASFLHGREFLLAWKASALNEERLRRENITSQYEALKNQVNPHFLFNSLNALTRLVYEDADIAANFIKQLSDFYRYVLETRDQEVVSLQSEMEFVKTYLFLQKKRYKDALKFDIDLHDEEKIKVPPIAIQMLVENAIKHNEISQENPLFIRIYLNDENEIVVKNNLQRRNYLKQNSPGIGLENIKQRYKYLADKQVAISEESGSFEVRLPVLTFIP